MALPVDSKQPSLKIVLIEDDFPIRRVLGTLINLVAERNNYQTAIFTSEDGVQGVGYISITNPHVVVIDGHLPQYSGREIVEFLTTNPKYASDQKHVIVLVGQDDTLPKLPANYLVLRKDEPEFVNRFMQVIGNKIFRSGNPGVSKIANTAANWLIKLAHWTEKRYDAMNSAFILFKPIQFLLWLAGQFLISSLLFVFQLTAGGFRDTNTEQYNTDLRRFRIRHYPSAITFFSAIAFTLVQLGIFLVGTLAVITRLITPSYATWFDTDWTYRKALVVNGTAAGAQTDYVMQVIVNYGSGSDSGKNVYCDSHCKTDFGDIRFASSDETTMLSYFLEQKTDSTKANFWVKIPSIPASPSSTTIYMYYGNTGATTSSDPENTYLQFEGFESTPFDFDTGAGVLVQEAGGFTGSNHGTSNNGEVTGTIYQNDTQYAVDSHFFEGWIRYPTNGATNENLAGGLNIAVQGTSHNGYQLMLDGRPSGSRQLSNPYIREDGNLTGMTTGASTITNNTWYFIRGYRTSGTLSAEIYSDLYGSPTSTTTRGSESTYSTGYTGVFVYSILNADYDNFRVRKRANPEPTHGSWGGETTQSAVITVSSSGTQIADVYIPDTNINLGGRFIVSSSVPTSITSIKIREQGSINAQTGLDNIKLRYDLDNSSPYDCASESYSGSETQFGSTDTDGFDGTNGSSIFTGSASISSTASMCVYVVADITSSASSGNTIEIDIANPSSDLTALTGTVGPGTAVTLPGTTTATTPGWYNSAWIKRKRVTVASSSMGSGSTNLTDFPLAISLTTDTEISSWAQASGNDILFTAQDGVTKLSHEIEEYTSSSGKLMVWVKVNTLRKTADTVLYLYYGNVAAANQQDGGVWANYKGVWHMDENPAGSAPQIIDSTTAANHLSSAGTMTSGDSITGQMGKAINFDGSNDALSVADPVNGSLDIATEDFSVEAWIRTSSVSSMHLFGKGASGQTGYRVYLNSSQSSRPGVTLWGTTDTVDSTPGSYSHSLTNGSWHNLTITFDRDGNAVFYIDGTQVTTLAISSVDGESLANSEIFYVARYASSQFWNGDIDEFRIGNGVLNSDWVSTAYSNISSGLTPTLASEESAPSSGDVLVYSLGTQTTSIDFPTEKQYLGGTFVMRAIASGDSRTASSMTFTESGSMNATYLDNMRVYLEYDSTAPYDCVGLSYNGTETQIGSTNASAFTSANGSAQVSDTIPIAFGYGACVYVTVDLTVGIADASELEISIANPSTDIVLTSGSITQTSPVAVAGTTTMNDITAAWYNSSWTYRKRIVAQESQISGSTALTDFPLLVRFTSDTQLAANAQDDGDDILFTDSTGTVKIDHEIEKFNGTTGEAVVWVRVSSLSATANTTIYMYYGNASATNQQSVNATWNSAYQGVWHFNTDPSGATTIRNSAIDTLDGDQQGGMTSSNLVTAAIGDGYDFDGTDDRIVMGDQAYLDLGTSDFTLQAWVRVTSLSTTNPPIIAKGAWGNKGYRFEITGSTGRIRTRVEGDAAVETSPGSYSTLANSSWRALTVTYDRDASATFYVDGAQVATASISGANTSITNAENFFIGRNGGGNYWSIRIDEPRVRTGLLSADWVNAEYTNQTSPSSFYFLAGQEMTNVAPAVSNVVLNSGNNISLTASATKNVIWTASVTDTNGYQDISTVSGVVFRSSLGSSCSSSQSNCYQVASCSLLECSGNSCNAKCSANIYFFADPTDAGSAFSADTWRASITATDAGSLNNTALSPDSVTEMSSLVALAITGDISYGTVFPGNNSGGVNQTLVVSNVGNVPIDAEVSGSALCPDYPTCAGDTIPVGNQEYSLSPFTYGAGTDLSTTGTTVQLNLPKATAAPSNQTINTYWGIAIPTSLLPGSYTGANEFVAVQD